MSGGLQVLLANIPTIVCAVIGGLLVDRGHPYFAVAFLCLAYALAHELRRKDAA